MTKQNKGMMQVAREQIQMSMTTCKLINSQSYAFLTFKTAH